MKTYVVGTHKKRLGEVLLMSTHYICFHGKIKKHYNVDSALIWGYVRYLNFCLIIVVLTLNCQSQQLSSALSSACDFKSHFCKQCGPRSDCSTRSSLIWVHTVCLYAKIDLKSLKEYSADDINRQHFQMQVFLAL